MYSPNVLFLTLQFERRWQCKPMSIDIDVSLREDANGLSLRNFFALKPPAETVGRGSNRQG